jgi:Cu(I)/Ag(I) efflux system periplasmic protein CusF
MKLQTAVPRLSALLALLTGLTQAWAAPEMTEGVIRKIDIENNKLTLQHAEIKNLDMPAMTMVFQVKDRAMLDKLRPGAKVRFKASMEAGKFTVTEIEAAP